MAAARVANQFRLLVCLVCLLLFPLGMRASVILLIEDPVGRTGWMSDAGHASVWITDACLTPQGMARVCSGDRREQGYGEGLVLSNMPGWNAYGYSLIPAGMYLYGATANGEAAIPYSAKDVEPREQFWRAYLAERYPEVPAAIGQRMIGRAFRRRIYMIRLETTAAQDADALASIHHRLSTYHFHFWTRNCTDFARNVLQIYFPGQFNRRWSRDFALTTPQGLGDQTEKLGRTHPELHMQILRLELNRTNFVTYRRTQDASGLLLFDWKYALPLAFVSPVSYAGVAAMHVLNDGFHIGGQYRAHSKAASPDRGALLEWSNGGPGGALAAFLVGVNGPQGTPDDHGRQRMDSSPD